MIIGVAARLDGVIYPLPRPARHCHLGAEYNARAREGGWEGAAMFAGWPKLLNLTREQGFVDEYGIFLNRIEAAEHALACGQVAKLSRPPELFSEDLW